MHKEIKIIHTHTHTHTEQLNKKLVWPIFFNSQWHFTVLLAVQIYSMHQTVLVSEVREALAVPCSHTNVLGCETLQICKTILSHLAHTECQIFSEEKRYSVIQILQLDNIQSETLVKKQKARKQPIIIIIQFLETCLLCHNL